MYQNNPKVSVIIPVYNTEKYLRECLDSVVNQTLTDIEIICVDDGSTDGSPAILEEYRERDSRISVITQANGGPSSARNSGMQHAQGKYINFLDSDDLLVLNTLETAFKIAEKESLDAILFELEPFYESEQLAQNPPVHYEHISEATGIMRGVQYKKAMRDQSISTVNVVHALWRRAFLEEHNIRFQEGIIHEDNLFSFHAYMAADRVMRIPDRFYLRRVREKSIMTSPKSAKNVIGYFSCAVAVMQYALNNTDPDKQQESEREYTRMLGAARRNYDVISDEEKDKICFASEIENELFDQLIKDRARLDKSNEQVKLQIKRFQRELEDKRKESDTLRRELDNSRKESDALRRELDDSRKESDALRRELDGKRKESNALRRELDDKQKESDAFRRELEQQKQWADTLQYDLDCVHNSVSFRVGRAATWFPRKVRGGVWCFRDHGAGYTVRRTLYHMGLWKDEEANKKRRGCMGQPKVSVIIPVYNIEKYLRECLDSVVNQTLKDIEIICVDDGSTDDSLAILREYEAKDSRIKVLTQDNQFAGVARNHGMEIASGRYYAFLDSDDYYLPDALSRMFDRCEQYELDYIKAGYYKVEAGKEPYDTPYTVNEYVTKKDLGRRLSFPADMDSLRKAPDVPWNGLYRASFLKDNRIVFNNFRVLNDHSFFVNCVIHAKRAMIINDHVVCYRVNLATSLVGTRHKHFQFQIDNYYLVRRMVKNLDQPQKRKLLQREVREIFHWYNKLYPVADDFYRKQMYSQLSTFILDFDESDVGEPFLHSMPSHALYYSIRKKPAILERVYHMGLWKDEEPN